MSDDLSRKPLISFSTQENQKESENHDKFVESAKGSIRTITVEPIIACFSIIFYLQSYTMGQYIYYRIQKDYNLAPNDTLAHVCKPDLNNTDQELTDQIQSLNAEYGMYIQLSTCVFTIMTAPFYFGFSDRYGRKIMFLIPCVGVFLKSLFEVFIQVFNWPIYIFIITQGLYGLFGGFTFVTGLSYAYLADISTQKTRTRKIAIIGILTSIGSLCVSLVSGYWITFSGYLYPYIFTTGLALFCLLYIFFVLQEPPKPSTQKPNKMSPMQQFRCIFTIYIVRPRLQRSLLIIMLVIFNFYYVAQISNLGLSNTYLMSYPICMTSIEMSIFGFVNLSMVNVGSVLTAYILARWFSDLVIVVVCLLSGIAFSMQMGLATTQMATFIGLSTLLSIWIINIFISHKLFGLHL